MKRLHQTPAVTSLPQSPQEEATGRVRRYGLTMLIRIVCFALTVLVTPYGWYTWVFAIAAAILPYIAVVFANAVSPTATDPAELPTQQLSAPVSQPPTVAEAEDPKVITVQEQPKDDKQ